MLNPSNLSAPPLLREHILVNGNAGNIEVIIDFPRAQPHGIALVGHSHPLLGGTSRDKVTHTIAMTLAELGYITCRPSFRGTGRTEGEHDDGDGEAHDMVALCQHMLRGYPELPLLLAGFSFGAYVQSKAAALLSNVGYFPHHILLVSTALGNVANSRFYDTHDLLVPSVLIHGVEDERVPIQRVYDWAGRQSHSVIAIPEADHFFTGKLDNLRKIIFSVATTFPKLDQGPSKKKI